MIFRLLEITDAILNMWGYGHQHICMDVALMLFARVGQFFKIELIVLVCTKNILAIIAALDNMLRLAGDNEAW